MYSLKVTQNKYSILTKILPQGPFFKTKKFSPSFSTKSQKPIRRHKVYSYFLGGYVAQLAEHRAFNLMAAGSSPAVPKNTNKSFY